MPSAKQMQSKLIFGGEKYHILNQERRQKGYLNIGKKPDVNTAFYNVL